ncbi:integrator complex subunit 5 isoform X4 [Folsomia candida]|uniref:integrator complex subunit 5 isoform X4 n=1 Tax=Folsomia candida TaxID=158441 RepID=UPI001604F1F7|nr:integrator complex subunit 5 isoform X4 [Folsomia candida]
MSFLDKFPSNPSPEETLAQLQRFLGRNSSLQPASSSAMSNNKGIKGKIKKSTIPEELSMQDLTHLGMWLIRHLPVSRDSVFEFISSTYSQFVKEYIIQQQGNVSSCTDDDLKLLDDIHEAFLTFLKANGEIWAPILSTWTLHLLGQLSKDYSHQIAFTHGAQLQNVNDTIRFWMGSKAIQSLMDLTARCLTCRDHANADTFISALIDTSTIHSPRFDWVVAHVGNTYPQTIVSQVLNLGFQHFSVNSPMASVKLNSVRAILEHLVGTHAKEVQQAFDQTIQQGLTDNSLNMVILYVMTMCSNSMPLLDVLMDTVFPRLNEETLLKLRTIVPKWIQIHFGGREVAAVALVTHLIMKSSRGPRALEILMKGCKEWVPPIGIYARTLLDHFIAEASSMFYGSDSPRKGLATNFPAFPAMKDNSSIIINFLTDTDPQIARAAKQFVKILSMYDGAAVGVKAICHYLNHSTDDVHRWHMVDLIAMLEMKYSNLLTDTLQILAIRSSNSDKAKISDKLRKWDNILKLVKSERETKIKLPIRQKMSVVLQENLWILTPLMDVRKLGFCLDEAGIVIEILSKLPELKNNSKFGTRLALQRHLVEFLFKVLALPASSNPTQKVKNVTNVSKLLYELAENPAIQNDSLRSLVQYSLYPECKQLFMKRVIGNPKLNYSAFDYDCIDPTGSGHSDNEFQRGKFSMYVSLMEENQSRSSVLNIAGSHATTFHSGKLLKNGIKNWSAMPKVVITENEDAYLNFELFLYVLMNVCMAVPSGGNVGEGFDVGLSVKDVGQVVSVEAMKKVALLLVEIVSPDVMFNGLPWPEEEFSKVQVERDLQIRRAFEDHPYLWDLLELVANHCPSLCYCSVLLRALMATLMAHWTSCQEAPAKNSPNQLEWTIRLLQIMRTGQLIPPPLCYIGQVVHELKSHEVLALLKDVWSYMKMNIPVPTIFIRKDAKSNRFIRNPEFSKISVNFQPILMKFCPELIAATSSRALIWPPKASNGL